MEKVCIFIDSGNFYHLVLRKLNLREIEFDFDGFVKMLANKRQITQDGKRFYVGTVREIRDGHKNRKAIANQTKLFSDFIGLGDWTIKTSKLRTRIEKIKVDDRVANYQRILNAGVSEIEYRRSREKGIDVKMAVDLIAGALDNKYDTAIIISSDADLVPAIDWVRKRLIKKVEYVGFSIAQTSDFEATRPTKTMIYNSDIQRVLVEADIHPFIKKNLFTSDQTIK